jgi:hypothetical protein
VEGAGEGRAREAAFRLRSTTKRCGSSPFGETGSRTSQSEGAVLVETKERAGDEGAEEEVDAEEEEEERRKRAKGILECLFVQE